jgi:hypothetical protein
LPKFIAKQGFRSHTLARMFPFLLLVAVWSAEEPLVRRRNRDRVMKAIVVHRAYGSPDLRERFYADARLSWMSLPFPEKGQFQ